jgi:hypothetical protein
MRAIPKREIDGLMERLADYWDIARSWNLIGDSAAAKAWVSTGMERSAEFLVKVVKGFVSFSVSSSQREYAMSEKPDEDLYDLNVLLNACKKHLNGRDLHGDDRRMIEAVVPALEQMLGGSEKPDASQAASLS